MSETGGDTLLCPSCHDVLNVEPASLSAPPGKVAYLTCPSCGHRASSSSFAREGRREMRRAQKVGEARRRALLV